MQSELKAQRLLSLPFAKSTAAAGSGSQSQLPVMFAPTSDVWKRIHKKTGHLAKPGRVSVPSVWHEYGGAYSSSEAAVSGSAADVRFVANSTQQRKQLQGHGQADGGSSSISGSSSSNLLRLHREQSNSLDSLSTLSGTGRRCSKDRAAAAEQLLRNLRNVHVFHSPLGSRDNREKLADYLRQCEYCMPRHCCDQLADVEPDLQTAWTRSPTEKNCSAGKAVKQQAAIWELLLTELNILRHLKTIIEIYIGVIHYLQSNANLLMEVSTERLFPGINQVLSAHCTLWSRHLKPALLVARELGCPVRPKDFAGGFADFERIFEPSLEFCLRISESKDYLKQLEKSEAFNDFAKWALKLSSKNYNSEDGSMDLQLKSLLTTPLQRLTKYGLLLQEILKHTEDPQDRDALEEMIRHVTDFCNGMNSRYREKADEEEVRAVAEKLEDAKLADLIDSFGEECSSYLGQLRLSLQAPMPHNGQPRRKLAESDFKMKDDRGKWSDVKLFLFTDLLLLAKPSGSKRQALRQLRAPVRLDKLTFIKMSDNNTFVLAVLSDFGCIESVHCLSANGDRDDWLERLSQSQASVRAQLGEAAMAAAAAAPCATCGTATAASPPSPPPPPPPLTPSTPPPPPRPRSRTTLLEVATHARLHSAHSSSELDCLDGGAGGAEAAMEIQHRQLHQVMQQQQQRPMRCNSAQDSVCGMAAAAEAELSPERQRLISFISSLPNRAPQV